MEHPEYGRTGSTQKTSKSLINKEKLQKSARYHAIQIAKVHDIEFSQRGETLFQGGESSGIGTTNYGLCKR
jgi:hypothetical protein